MSFEKDTGKQRKVRKGYSIPSESSNSCTPTRDLGYYQVLSCESENEESMEDRVIYETSREDISESRTKATIQSTIGKGQDSGHSYTESTAETSHFFNSLGKMWNALPFKQSSGNQPRSSQDSYKPHNTSYKCTRPMSNDTSIMRDVFTKDEMNSIFLRKLEECFEGHLDLIDKNYKSLNEEHTRLHKMRLEFDKECEKTRKMYSKRADMETNREQFYQEKIQNLTTNLSAVEDENQKIKLNNTEFLEKNSGLHRYIGRLKQEQDTKNIYITKMEQTYKDKICKFQENLDELKDELSKKKEESRTLLSNLHEHLKQIRATDDDYSTIQTKLNTIQAKISNLCMSLKKFLTPNEEQVLSTLYDYFDDRNNVLDQFLCERDNGLMGMDYSIVSLLVERFITIHIVRYIYNMPIYLGLDINYSYSMLSEWEPFKNNKNWSRILRQQLCSLAAKPDVTDGLEYKRKDIASWLIQKLSMIFIGIDQKTSRQICNIIDLAAQLSLAMNSQDVPIKHMTIVEGQTKIKPCMAAQHGSVEGATTVQLIICPPFVINEGQESEVVLLEGKVICMDFPDSSKGSEEENE
ncbi:hypothetical protein PHYBLDRAFT_60744 [Phycomyces blakesleeanus NRRL 1555(-)]|uniref:Uncharacterized protein n=2 Tax=Phycomyces blakesleeanus TaxID=4837 RepID=A0A162Y0P4_PHYB8|nr:hypothetical protein PHYBLDRAFT_60744 [Phycomyces blakesleeanus NRRL 1555(-)]OAD77615.1 hypothetical protein PHYBLDRAFT_60744 [Phycomyces blakesleeanus NRRL 1555(-)]|eukprot:XP_018295655.1 hypothetical protein PHYBLDRAFT_60744 [Phycomyces blakesleeanus NRRL 1555(-)]